MAVTPIVGLTGTITLPGNMVQWVSSITLETGPALLPTSHYGGSGWVTRVCGVKDLQGTAIAIMTKGVTGSNPFAFVTTPSPMTILFDTGCLVTFDCVIGSTQVVGEYLGENIISFTFAKATDEPPTINWVTA